MVRELLDLIAADGAPACDMLVCPPAILIGLVGGAVRDTAIDLGAQDCHTDGAGAHTGDISASMVADAGCAYVIVGHSERRADHGEGDALVRAKAEAALEAGLTPIICLGETLADAAGEALDKFGKLLGLPYPAGPEIDRLAVAGDPTRFQLPRGMRGRSDLAMSFSGLKTAGRQLIDRLRAAGEAPEQGDLRADLCASYQAAVVTQLVETTRRAARRSGLEQLVIAGGVAANSLLRSEMTAMCAEEGLAFRPVPPRLCTDNGAMIAALGGAILAIRPGDDPHDLDASATRRQAQKPARRSKPGGRP